MEKKLFGNICFTRLVKALMLSYFLTMLMLLGLSFGLYKFDLSEKTVRIGILAVYIISTFAGGFAMGKMGKTRKFLRGFMLGMLYFLLLLAISAGIYRSVQGGMQMMIAWILCGAGGMLGGMVSRRGGDVIFALTVSRDMCYTPAFDSFWRKKSRKPLV